MSDASLKLLIDKTFTIAESTELPCLLIVGEPSLDATQLKRIALQKNIHLLSNRFDQVVQAQQIGIHATFNDFIFDTQYYACIAMRLSKEKIQNEYLLQQIGKLLQLGAQQGILLISGYKYEGIKNWSKRCQQAFNTTVDSKKHGDQLWLLRINKSPDVSQFDPTVLQTKQYNYQQLYPLSTVINGITIQTKPGIFGWQQVDIGSQLLINQTLSIHSHSNVLDLGCGYGYLALNALKYQPKHIVLTDNCAAAVNVAKLNMQQSCHQLNSQTTFEVIADHIGSSIQQSFDIILCNPPFHKGVKRNHMLSMQFIHAINRFLKPRGICYYVINEFIGIESMLADTPLTWQLLDQRYGFKVGLLQRRQHS